MLRRRKMNAQRLDMLHFLADLFILVKGTLWKLTNIGCVVLGVRRDTQTLYIRGCRQDNLINL